MTHSLSTYIAIVIVVIVYSSANPVINAMVDDGVSYQYSDGNFIKFIMTFKFINDFYQVVDDANVFEVIFNHEISFTCHY